MKKLKMVLSFALLVSLMSVIAVPSLACGTSTHTIYKDTPYAGFRGSMKYASVISGGIKRVTNGTLTLDRVDYMKGITTLSNKRKSLSHIDSGRTYAASFKVDYKNIDGSTGTEKFYKEYYHVGSC